MSGEFGPGYDPDMRTTPEEMGDVTVTESECDIRQVIGGGPGGQKINKTASKIALRFSPQQSTRFSAEKQAAIITYMRENRPSHWVESSGEIKVDLQTERSMLQNKREAMEILNTFIVEALTPVKDRKPTKPTKGSRERRMDSKRMQGAKKRGRKFSFDE